MVFGEKRLKSNKFKYIIKEDGAQNNLSHCGSSSVSARQVQIAVRE